ncbi:MAG: DUF1579 domain-containing protein [Stygiobacter sp.]
MKVSKFFFVLFSLIYSVNSIAQDQEQMMKKWQEAITPGKMHELLSKMVGEWDTEMTLIDPSGQEMKSKGVSKTESILGGRYFLTSQSGMMMGMPFEGKGLDAYDNVAKEFVSIWVDNMGTGVTVMKGYYDEKTKTLNYKGESLDAMTGQAVIYRTVTKIDNDNKISFDMYSIQNGKEAKMFTMIYTRKN